MSTTLPKYAVDSEGALDPPPPYAGPLPAEICLVAGSYCDRPITMKMRGQSRSPDFTLYLLGEKPWYHFSTDSNLIYHETSVKDLARNQGVFTIKRKSIDGVLRYTIHKPGRDGQKLLELDTRPKLLSGSPIRLIFRSTLTSELDELTMTVGKSGSHGEVLYNGERVADIVDIRSGIPEYRLDLHRPCLDPLLIMILAYVVDDRSMTTLRRYGRSVSTNFPGLARKFALGAS